MLKKRKFWLAFFLLLGILIAFLLYPLSSSKWEFEFDAEKLAFKNEFLSSLSSPDSVDKRPNIIIILADDLGKTDISLYGSKFVKTPFMDDIGHNGVVCTEGYVTSPICSPSRASMLTGRYQQRFGYEVQPQNRYPKNRLEYYVFKYIMDTGNWIVRPGDSYPTQKAINNQGLPPTEITLSELLQKVGYRTGIIGKWHLGFKNDVFLPHRRGFDYQYGFYEAFSLYADTTDENIVNQHHTDFTDWYIWGQGRKGGFAIRRNDTIIEEKEYITTKIAKEAINFIDRNKQKPFFLYVPFSAPHTPFQVTKEYFDQFAHIQDKNKRVYYAMIKSLDDAIGSILQKLKKEGLEENTIIFFASDNGGAAYTKATDNAPLKGGKISPFEGGLNVPLMIQWKAQIPAGIVYEYPVNVMDFFKTSVDLAGVDLPTDRTYDSVNLIPFLTGNIKTKPHPALYWRSLDCKAIRKEDWKLILNRGEVILYNLEEDKEESRNLAEEHPDVVTELTQEISNWEKGLIPPLWPHVMDYRFVISKEEEYIFTF